MRHDGDRLKTLLANQLGNVLNVLQVRIGAAEGPLGVAVTTQVRGHDMESVTQRLRQPIPGVAVVVDAVDQEHVGRVVVPPIQVVQPQALGEIAMGGRVLAVGHRGAVVACGFAEAILARRTRESVGLIATGRPKTVRPACQKKSHVTY